MNAATAAADYTTQHALDILRVAAGSRQKALAALRDLETELARQIAAGPSSINQAARLRTMLGNVQEAIRGTYQGISSDHREDLKGLARLSGAAAVAAVNAGVSVDVFGTTISASQLEKVVDGKSIFGNSSGDWWKLQSVDLQQRFSAAMTQGLLLGETVAQLTARVSAIDGIMTTKKRQAEALARSSAISVSNAARMETFRTMSDVIRGIQWVSTLDTRTTPICRALDGLTWDLDLKPIGHNKAFPGPTAHWNCRSTQVPVLKSWEDLAGKKLPSLNRGDVEKRMREKLAKRGWSPAKIDKAVSQSRASMDGQVAESMTFDEWLNTKAEPQVESMLGPGRAKLWNSGAVTVADLTDQTNRPLTLKQLAAAVEAGTPVPETLGLSVVTTPPTRFQKVPATAADIRAAAEIKKALKDDRAREMNQVLTESPDLTPSAALAAMEEKIKARKEAEKERAAGARVTAALVNPETAAIAREETEKGGTFSEIWQRIRERLKKK